MNRFLIRGLPTLSMLLLTTLIHAQAPTITWDKFLPGDWESGNYSANDIKQSPYGGYVITGSRKIAAANGYSEVMVMRVDEEAGQVRMNRTFGGVNVDSIPWDQVAYDMIVTPTPYISYLVTGYRDTTLTSRTTNPGLLLMEVWGNGQVLFDSLYYNNNLHDIKGRCIQPAIGGGYIIAGSIAEDGGGTEKIMMITVKKNEKGEYDVIDMPYVKVNTVGQNGYARWIRQFGDGYVLGGSAYNGTDKKLDMFIQKVGADRYEEWTMFYGYDDTDEFSDAVISGDQIYLAGSANVPIPGTSNHKYQIYVVKADSGGNVIWEKTYGGANRHLASEIEMTGDGDLLVAGAAYVTPSNGQMVLLKIDAETGDSLWMQDYGSYYSAGIMDMIRTSDFGYITAGRASYTASQDPRVYVMKLNSSATTANLAVAKTNLHLDIDTGTPTKDVIEVTADKIALYGICVKIDSLLHPSVGDLELTLEHAGASVTLVKQPFHSGENFIGTALIDAAEVPVESGYAPYSGWFRPEEPLAPFLFHDPSGEWTLTVTDHGTGGLKATSGVLEGWSLNLLTDSGSGTGIPAREALMNFGLEQVRPNPFNHEAMIGFRIAAPGHVRVTVYNQLGQLVGIVADEELPEGVYERMWQPERLAAGTYFIHLESGGMVSVRKAVLAW